MSTPQSRAELEALLNLQGATEKISTDLRTALDRIDPDNITAHDVERLQDAAKVAHGTTQDVQTIKDVHGLYGVSSFNTGTSGGSSGG